MSYTVQPISIRINHKFITPPAISTLRGFSLSQNRQPTLAQPNFHIPFTKVASTHPSIKYFQIFWCHKKIMIDETFSHTYLWKFPKKVSQFLIGRLFKCVNFLLRHPVVRIILKLELNRECVYLRLYIMEIRSSKLTQALIVNPTPTRIESGETYARSPMHHLNPLSRETNMAPISGVFIRFYENTPFPGLSREILSRQIPRMYPLPRGNGNTHAAPSVGGGHICALRDFTREQKLAWESKE